MMDDKVVAMLLAGGQGSRLKTLTSKIAKPAVPFGGKYRIIDYALSNATNSGIRDIGILTQYKPFLLNSHIGIGSSWDFDRTFGGLKILPPFTSEDGGRWYTGTANAIYENIDFIDNLAPEYVLILSGDHIYKMNYQHLLDVHKENNANVTISVLEVPWEDTSRFGIINVDRDKRIIEFEEKPENAKNNMASMGIYMFNWKDLREYLIKDNEDENSSNDFGKNILPKMLDDGKRMYAWVFEDYWKDVGTIRSYWEANMDLLDEKNTLNLYDRDWRIYTKNKNLPPQHIAKNSIIKNSLVNEACDVKGEVKNSVLFSNIVIEKDAKINNSVILSNCVIRSGAEVNNAVILEDITIEVGSKIGTKNDDNIYLVSDEGILIE
ncbi:glucose-1-phosphate adenylyltransferase [Clostridium sp. D2Q-11]|uniref:Glucose-1-phosphate adenylyltransferase n=1 Tax=Anaeromonas frigoriresistens TaxID=2683708 RepID=A0A942UUR2_9FIRM|nr:glucose-1-phosphate adenylyltransferase [Anaeromonas frigoriresistens]MBS4538365.1 glucose-1-phosphate adenylyltransferase [Anaeromonas frigoriresistens]